MAEEKDILQDENATEEKSAEETSTESAESNFVDTEQKVAAEKADKEILKYVTGNLLVEDPATGTTIMCRDGRVIISREGTEKDWSSLSPEEKMKFYNIFSELIY